VVSVVYSNEIMVVLVSLTQLVGQYIKIYKVWVQTPATTKKNKMKSWYSIKLFNFYIFSIVSFIILWFLHMFVFNDIIIFICFIRFTSQSTCILYVYLNHLNWVFILFFNICRTIFPQCHYIESWGSIIEKYLINNILNRPEDQSYDDKWTGSPPNHGASPEWVR